jgi:hypothetical protein
MTNPTYELLYYAAAAPLRKLLRERTNGNIYLQPDSRALACVQPELSVLRNTLWAIEAKELWPQESSSTQRIFC